MILRITADLISAKRSRIPRGRAKTRAKALGAFWLVGIAPPGPYWAAGPEGYTVVNLFSHFSLKMIKNDLKSLKRAKNCALGAPRKVKESPLWGIYRTPE